MAVETALIAPLMIFILLQAIDIGLQVQTMQKMNKAADSGIEYLVNGGRDQIVLHNIVQDAYGNQLSYKDLSIEAYCGCIVSGQSEQNESTEADNADPYEAFYLKTLTNLNEDMCAQSCENGSEPTQLVNVTFKRTVRGTMTSKNLQTHLQTRIK